MSFGLPDLICFEAASTTMASRNLIPLVTSASMVMIAALIPNTALPKIFINMFAGVRFVFYGIFLEISMIIIEIYNIMEYNRNQGFRLK
jgi:hypothetical protein